MRRASRTSERKLTRKPATSGAGRWTPKRAPLSKRVRLKQLRGGLANNVQLPYTPPENWHEPTDSGKPYRFVVQPAGEGYRHILTPEDVRRRLAVFPAHFLRPLEVVQFSRMTRKKRSFPCYGMQWGAALYLYPVEEDLVERYTQQPKPQQINEARMYGGQWRRVGDEWLLEWTEEAIRDFYLNNILVHELGHVLDNRNTRPVDRERFAEWFAVQYGYLPTMAQRAPRKIVRRHG